MGNSIFFWWWVCVLCVKEIWQIVCDFSSWLIVVVIFLLLLFIFGYGINFDFSRLWVGVLFEQQSEEVLDFVYIMIGLFYIDVIVSDSCRQLIEMMQVGCICVMVVILVDFDCQMVCFGVDVLLQFIIDGSEFNIVNFVQGYVEGIW